MHPITKAKEQRTGRQASAKAQTGRQASAPQKAKKISLRFSKHYPTTPKTNHFNF